VNSAIPRVRRATLDDIGQLTEIWKAMRYPVEDLSKRITEFQVAENTEGKIDGALGLEIAQRQGRIHSEGFSDFSLADQLRPLLWERINVVATNHGLLRLWTQEQAPFWNRCGLVKPDVETMEKLPAVWRTLPPAWQTLKLKDDVESLISLDKEFALFMESEKQRTQKAFQQARILKLLATLIAFALFILVIAGGYIIVRNNPHLLHRGP